MHVAKVRYELLWLFFFCIFLISTSVSYAAPPPKVTISADKNSVISGGTATLTWRSTNATTASMEPGIGTVDLNGSMPVTLFSTTTYTITVSNGSRTKSENVTVTVIQGNSSPVANDDTVSTNPDTPVTINVLANDTDADGDTLHLESFTQPANGIVVDNGDETVTYTPNSEFTGSDFFSYSIIDGKGGTDSAQVIIAINQITVDPPSNVASSFQNDNSILITWSAPLQTNIDNYRVYKRTAGSEYTNDGYSIVPAGSLSYTEKRLNAGLAYFYRITAVDSLGNESQYSPETGDIYYDFPGNISNATLIKSYSKTGNIAATGDLNGDGLQDIAIGDSSFGHTKTKAGPGAVYIFLGGSSKRKPDIKLVGQGPVDAYDDARFGYSLAIVDMNNDGFDDLIVSDPAYSRRIGRIYGYAGGAQMATTPSFVITGDKSFVCGSGNTYHRMDGENIGMNICPAGDLNGDGYQDVISGNPKAGEDRSGSVIVMEGDAGFTGHNYQIGHFACDSNMGKAVAPAGDVNGDGYDDIIVSVKDKAYLYLGNTGQVQGVNFFFGKNNPDKDISVAGLDFNADGFSDIATTIDGIVRIYYGGLDLNPVPDLLIPGAGKSVASLGDVNNDGYDDLLNENFVLLGNNHGEGWIDLPTNISFNGIGDVDGDGKKDIITPESDVYSFAKHLALPQITLLSPATSEFHSQSLSIDGLISGNIKTLFVDGIKTQLLSDNAFHADRTLSIGSNKIEIICELSDNQLVKKAIDIQRSELGSLSISAIFPTDGTTVVNQATPLNISGSTNYPLASLIINGINASISRNTFQAEVDLAEGQNAMTIIAGDIYNQTISQTYTIRNWILPPTVVFTALPTTIDPGRSARLTWNCTHADLVTIDNGIGPVDTSGYIDISPAETTVYTITADNGFETVTKTVTVNVSHPLPQVSLSTRQTEINAGETATLTWSSSDATSCSLSPDIGNIDLNGSVEVSPTETTTYIISATGPGGTVTHSVTIAVIVPPELTFSANPESILPGDSATLTWSTFNADTVSIDNGIGSVALNDSLSVTPSVTTTYTITATGPGGQVTEKATINVVYPPPSVNVTIDPGTSITQGEPAILNWTSTYTNSLTISPDIGTVSANGAITVIPAETTTYTFTATGPGGSSSFDVTITVLPNDKITIQGIVKDTLTGLPLAGASVSFTDAQQTHTAVSQSDGSYTVSGISIGSVNIKVELQGYVTYKAQAGFSIGGIYALDFDLLDASGPSTVQGIVKDALTGLPLAGASVSFTDAQQTHTAVSQNDGSYTVSGISIGSVDVTVELQGYVTYEGRTSISIAGTYEFDFDLLDASGSSSVQGTIINSKTLEPEPGVTVSLKNSDNSCVTSQDGTYILNNVPYGLQTLHIYKEDIQNSDISISVGIDPFPMDLAVPYRLAETTPEKLNASPTGTIIDSITGSPIPGSKISVVGESIEVITDQDGKAFLGLPPEKHNVILLITALNYEAVLATPEVAPGGSETFSVSLSPAAFGTITGSVINADTGEPVSLAGIGVGKGVLAGAQTEPDGTYDMRAVPVGTYTVSAAHPAYETAEQTDIVVLEGETATVNFTLTSRPRTGSLEGIVRDKDSQAPIAGAVVLHLDTGSTTTTDIDGYYRLDTLPAGMVNLSVQASGYPDAERRYAVDADIDGATPTVTVFDIDLSLTDPTGPDTISALVTASEGGNIETPDKRFQVVIPPHSLSADAIVTLMPVTSGLDISQGDVLTLDPNLGDNTVTALGQGVQIALEPVLPGDPVPTLESWVVLAGRYPQNTVESLDLDEQAIFPYYWNGSHWTALQIKPFEAAVDEVNNRHIAVVNFSTTQSGDPVVADLNTKTPVLLAAIDDYLPDLDIARIYKFALAAKIMSEQIKFPANVYIYDKDELTFLNTLPEVQVPNPNGLPLLIIHGWTPAASYSNRDHTDPNTNTGYKYMVEDLAKATNGVYRPMFGTYNPRSSIIYTGNALANAYQALNIKGKHDGTDGITGEFPFINTFGFSMGGLVSRTFQKNHQGVHKMIMAGTPNHGTHLILKKLNELAGGSLQIGTDTVSPGTADLFSYNDGDWFGCFSDNPTLYSLNRSPDCMPLKDITLIAGTKGIVDPLLDPLLGENDMVVPVDSVFCRTTNLNDGDKSLLKVPPGNKITEIKDEFTHLNFSTDEYRIIDHDQIYIPIQQGLSDWVVGKSLVSNVVKYDDYFTVASADFQVEVQHNVWDNTYDRVVLAIYAMDTDNNWHVKGDYVNESGNVIKSEPIEANSKDQPTRTLQTNVGFAQDENIWQVKCELVPLNPGQTKVSLTPDADFLMPQ